MPEMNDERNGPIHGHFIHWKKCGDSYNGWTCDLRMGHEKEETVCCETFPSQPWHSDRRVGKQWQHQIPDDTRAGSEECLTT